MEEKMVFMVTGARRGSVFKRFRGVCGKEKHEFRRAAAAYIKRGDVQ